MIWFVSQMFEVDLEACIQANCVSEQVKSSFQLSELKRGLCSNLVYLSVGMAAILL